MDDFEEIARARWEELYPTPDVIIKKFKGINQELDEIVLELKPSRELNILIAKFIMGHIVLIDAILGEMEGITDLQEGTVWATLQQYSEDLEAANTIVDRMVAEGHLDALLWHQYGDGKYTPAEAICKRALIRKVFGEKG